MKETVNKKCTCGKQEKITCPNCSVLKMVIMLKNKQHHLKYIGSTGKRSNPVWYNHLSKNRKSINELMDGMVRRFTESEAAIKYQGVTNKLMFFDNITKQLIKSYSV